MLIDRPYYDYDYEYVEPKKERRVMSDEERRKALTNNFGFKMKLRGAEDAKDGGAKNDDDLARAEALQKAARNALGVSE